MELVAEKHAIIDHQKAKSAEKRRQRKTIAIDDMVKEPSVPPDRTMETLEMIGKALDQLSDKERLAFEEVFLLEKSYREAAAKLGTSVENVRKLIYRGRSRL